ncbi:hypothetical protein [Dickeya oryzae]|uniref:Transposase DDE domain-containing protein n=1 Tax=Dickeya oryzae TaxID=1240404 RepID=A0AB39IW81_9GAMM|nr:hypothetical protein [Dickeya oryzae]MBP2849407.1 hypothetical protein [Dickeya oryzae]MCA6989995.1 hypothetical protein [Dickeya oryzae]
MQSVGQGLNSGKTTPVTAGRQGCQITRCIRLWLYQIALSALNLASLHKYLKNDVAPRQTGLRFEYSDG